MADFGPPLGPEQAGVRPAIVIQDDALNQTLTTTIVVPLTTKLRRLSIPTTLFLPAGEAGLPQDSVALCHQVQVRGKARLISKVGEISPARLSEIQEGVRNALGL
jgi:mRNA interferase MazF